MASTDLSPPRFVLTTASEPGAIACIQLHGGSLTELLHALTGRVDWISGRVRLVGFDRIDHGLVCWSKGLDGKDWAQLMPHGGPRVVQKLVHRLLQLGAVNHVQPDPLELYPEARDWIEAEVLAAIALAASPAAIDVFANQSRVWRPLLEGDSIERYVTEEQRSVILARSKVLDRLIHPPSVVVVGRPNVGKSTFTNRLLGRSASIVADLPGTTRDWVGGLAEIGAKFEVSLTTGQIRSKSLSLGDSPRDKGDVKDRNLEGGVTLRWVDTPGLRRSPDPIEQQAIQLARWVIQDADVLISMRDPSTDWASPENLPRRPDLWVLNKIDLVPESPQGTGSRGSPLGISAVEGWGFENLEQRVLKLLDLDRIVVDEVWAFCPKLKTLLEVAY